MNKNVLSVIGLPLLLAAFKSSRSKTTGSSGSTNLEEYLKALFGVSTPEIKITVSFAYTPAVESWSQDGLVYHDFPEHVQSVLSDLQSIKTLDIEQYYDAGDEEYDGYELFENYLNLPDAFDEVFIYNDKESLVHFIEALPNKVSYDHSRTYNDYQVTEMAVEQEALHLYDSQEEHHLYGKYSQWLQDNNKPNTEQNAHECLNENWGWIGSFQYVWDNLTEDQWVQVTFHFPINEETLKMSRENFIEQIQSILEIAEKHVQEEQYAGRNFMQDFSLDTGQIRIQSSEPNEIPVKIATTSIRRY